MRKLLGLSLTANTVAWTLVDLADGTIIADDVVEVDSAENMAEAAANRVEALAAKPEQDIDAIRIAWSKGTAGSAVKLTSTLRSLGFRDTDLIPEDEARHSRNRTARYIDPPLEIAYGAARTVTAEDHDRPMRRMAARLPSPRVLMAVASSVVVMAVCTAAAGYYLTGRAPSPSTDHASAPVASAPPADGPWFVAPPAALPPPPPPEAAVGPPAALTLPPVEAAPTITDEPEVEVEAAPTITDEPEVEAVPESAALSDTAPTPMQADTMAGQAELAAEGPSALSTTAPVTAHLPNTTTAPGPAPALTMVGLPHLTEEAPPALSTAAPVTAHLPDTTSAPGPAPALTMVGQPHLTAEAPSAGPFPGPVPSRTVVGVLAPPAVPQPPPIPFNILAVLP